MLSARGFSCEEHRRPLAIGGRAIEQGHADVVDVLLISGADIEARGTWLKITPLAKAAFEGRSSMVDLLVKRAAKVGLLVKGADPNTARGQNLWTPLHQAASRIVAALIEHGASPKSRDRDGKTPLDVAHEKRRTAVVKVLEGA
jgi:ankyrin repeat protein